MITALAIALLPLSACSADSSMGLSLGDESLRHGVGVQAVDSVTVPAANDSTITLRWTQVDDGAGQPASYRIEYSSVPTPHGAASAPRRATAGCHGTLEGTGIGAPMGCTLRGLQPGTTYTVRLMSYGISDPEGNAGLYAGIVIAGTEPEPAAAVRDLAVTAKSRTTLSVGWTQVDDGAGGPASYELRYASPWREWNSAAVACDGSLTGTEVGEALSCTIRGLTPGTRYDVQVMSYRVVDGAVAGAAYSDIVGDTLPDPGIWIGASRLSRLATSGMAWDNVVTAADASCGVVDLSDQEQTTNVCVMAKALVYARTGDAARRADVVTAITQIVDAGTYVGRALALGRELGAYVIAADLIDLKRFDPVLDGRFRATLRTLRTTVTSGASTSLIDCHESRPNNWGAHCGATRAAIAVYLGDTADLARTAQVFKGYLGDRSAYAGFRYGGPAGQEDLSWQCDPTRPVGINPAGCVRSGLSLDGVLPDDQRRGGSFTTSPPKESYVWEALQGLLAQAVILNRAGYPVWEWQDRALLRAVRWLHDVVDYPAEGDDGWQPHIVNYYYGSTFPAPVPSRPGKNVGWTDWTHSSGSAR